MHQPVFVLPDILEKYVWKLKNYAMKKKLKLLLQKAFQLLYYICTYVLHNSLHTYIDAYFYTFYMIIFWSRQAPLVSLCPEGMLALSGSNNNNSSRPTSKQQDLASNFSTPAVGSVVSICKILFQNHFFLYVKFRYSEKATKFT